ENTVGRAGFLQLFVNGLGSRIGQLAQVVVVDRRGLAQQGFHLVGRHRLGETYEIARLVLDVGVVVNLFEVFGALGRRYFDGGRIGMLAAAAGIGGLGLADLQIDPGLAQAFGIGGRIGAADDVQLQCRTVVQRLGQRGDALVGVGGQNGAAGLEVDVRQ